MTIDEGYVSNAEAVRRGHEADMRRREADYQAELLLESVEAEEARRSGIFRRSAAEREEVHYEERPAIDSRMFAIEGDLVEQARRDAERHGFPGDAA